MNKKAIVWLVIGCSLILVGAVTFFGVLAMFKWDFKKFSTVEYITDEIEITEEYKSIKINSDTADIEIVPSLDGKSRVTYCVESKLSYSIEVVDGTLTVELVDTRKWYEYIGIGFGDMNIKISIPEGEYRHLFIEEHTGDVTVAKDFSFESIDIKASTGGVKNHASTSGDMKIKANTGHISVEGVSAGAIELSVSTGEINASSVNCAGEVKVDVSTGKVYFTDVSCESLASEGDTGDISLKGVVAVGKLSVERSTGDVTLDGADAAEIFIKTDTGDVSGTLLSEKVFITKTSTGKIKVPSTMSGGKCEIETSTGDIKISIK